jgi:hypothetical protein
MREYLLSSGFSSSYMPLPSTSFCGLSVGFILRMAIRVSIDGIS